MYTHSPKLSNCVFRNMWFVICQLLWGGGGDVSNKNSTANRPIFQQANLLEMHYLRNAILRKVQLAKSNCINCGNGTHNEQ